MSITIKSERVVNVDIQQICESSLIDWQCLRNKTILITGVTGMIGSFLAKFFSTLSTKYDLNIKVIGIVRNKKKAKTLFQDYSSRVIKIIKKDINKPFNYLGKVDYILHCANNTDSRSFVERPVETIEIAIDGTKNVLEFARKKKVKSLVFLSSMEVYGQTDKELLAEEDIGYLDTMDVRNSYPLGKRLAETLCHSYAKEYNLPVKIARLGQIISSNVSYNDKRVIAYFAKCVLEKKDIVLKTTGETVRSFCYITDTITGLMTILLKGEDGEVYNLNNESFTKSIKDIAEEFANMSEDTNVRFELDDTNIYAKNVNWALSTDKLKKLGWKATTERQRAYKNLINSLKEGISNV